MKPTVITGLEFYERSGEIKGLRRGNFEGMVNAWPEAGRLSISRLTG